MTFYDVFNFWKIKKKKFWRFLTIWWRFLTLPSILVPSFDVKWCHLSSKLVFYVYWRHLKSNLTLILFFDDFWRHFTLFDIFFRTRPNSSKFIDYCKIIKNFRYWNLTKHFFFKKKFFSSRIIFYIFFQQCIMLDILGIVIEFMLSHIVINTLNLIVINTLNKITLNEKVLHLN